VIADVKDEEIAAINEFLKRDCIEIKPLDSEYILDIKITLFEGDHYASVRIVDSHTNIILIEKDNEILFSKENQKFNDKIVLNYDELNVADIYEFACLVK